VVIPVVSRTFVREIQSIGHEAGFTMPQPPGKGNSFVYTATTMSSPGRITASSLAVSIQDSPWGRMKPTPLTQ
jgi:hypothetical protein